VKSPDIKKESEAQLITRAQQGDKKAFGELVLRHHTPVFTSLYHLSGDREKAEDATQQAFIQAWLHLPGYQPRSSLRSWISRIAINAWLDGVRREKHNFPDESVLEYMADPRPEPEKALIIKQRAHTIQKALLVLNDSTRAVLVLREYGGLSYQEISSTLEIPLGTVMSRLNHARNQLRNVLQPLLEEVEVENE
jgi:RNA polymerase sigma-70 factor (ECF subfamily)